jgi:hypothetical protein
LEVVVSFPRACTCALLLLLLSSTAAFAKSHGGDADTVSFLPRWVHPWFEIGGDWLGAPRSLRGPYESGQAAGLGLSVRPMHRLELRSAFDYQTLQTTRSGRTAYLWGYDKTGHALSDTLSYTSSGQSWALTVRPEVGMMALPDVWLTGGIGGGYMNGGFDNALVNIDAPAHTPAAMHNGWGWLWTAAARWDIQPDPALPLGMELRTTSLKRGPDFVRTWAVRVTYRMPHSMRRGLGR